MNQDFTYRPTKAFWKINKLFERKESLFIVQGGQGASKTISILMIIIDACNRSKKDITICSAEKSKLMDTAFRDFVKILKDWNVPMKSIHEREGVINFASGSYIEFIGLDKADVGKGRRRDIIYINEANKITLNSFADIAQRAKLMICDYNPDALFWLNDLQTETNFINLTYLDNEYLPKQEVANIERYKTLGYNEDGTVKNEFWANKWRVYGLGEVGSVEGRIYHWKKINDEDYNKIITTPIYSVDWGMVDPMAVTEVRYFDGNIYVREINYASENEIRSKLSSTEQMQINAKENDGLITHLFTKWGIPKNSIIICDSNYPNKILTLRKAGWEGAYAIGAKSKLLDRIAIMSSLNIFYTASSKNIEFEGRNYSYAQDKWGKQLETPIDAHNHQIDSISYACTHMINHRIINIV